MDIKLTTRVAILAAILISIPFVYTLQCTQPAYGKDLSTMEAQEQARNILRTIVSAQMAHYAKNGRYGTTADLAGTFLDDRFASDPADLGYGCWAKIIVDEGGQSFLAVSKTAGAFFVAGESGQIYTYKPGDALDHPRKDEVQNMLAEIEGQQTKIALAKVGLNSIRHAVSGEFAYYAQNGHYGTSTELLAGGFVADRFAGDPADLGDGCWIKIKPDPDGQSFLLVCSAVGTILVAGETGEIFTFDRDQPIQHGRSEEIWQIVEKIEKQQYINATNEYARNQLRNVVSAQFAHYAQNGFYGTVQELAGTYISDEFVNDPSELDYGCWIKINPGADGQSFLAVSSLGAIFFVGDETGQITNYGLDGETQHSPDEEVSLMLAEIAVAKAVNPEPDE